jgi:hypothetical protein
MAVFIYLSSSIGCCRDQCALWKLIGKGFVSRDRCSCAKIVQAIKDSNNKDFIQVDSLTSTEARDILQYIFLRPVLLV